MNNRTALYGVVWALLLSGCAATSTISVWQDDTFSGPPFEHLLVVAVSSQPGDRKIFESEFAKAIVDAGKNATASSRVMPGEEKLSAESVKAAIAGTGIDAVLVTSVVGVDERESYVAPPTYSRTYYGYYATSYDFAYQSGYYHQYSVYHLETNVYDVQSEELVWTMRSEAVAPKSVAQVVASLSKQIIAQLKKDQRI